MEKIRENRRSNGVNFPTADDEMDGPRSKKTLAGGKFNVSGGQAGQGFQPTLSLSSGRERLGSLHEAFIDCVRALFRSFIG